MILHGREDPDNSRTNLTPTCGNCDCLFGYKEFGWCCRWEIFVWGHQDCPEWERRDMSIIEPEVRTMKVLDDMHDGLSLLGELAHKSEDPKLQERFRIAEISVLKFLRAFREKYGISYEDDE